MFINKTILPRRSGDLLMASGLSMPTHIDETVGVYEGSKLVGAGSLSDNILKGIAVDKAYRGAGITAHIIDGLLDKAYARNIYHLLIRIQYYTII